MNKYQTLDDLKEKALENGNENPGIFILSNKKTEEQNEDSFPPSDVFIDFEGDIIIKFNEKYL